MKPARGTWSAAQILASALGERVMRRVGGRSGCERDAVCRRRGRWVVSGEFGALVVNTTARCSFGVDLAALTPG